MEKLVHCDKMYEFIRRQEPINAHHNSAAANVGHFQILILSENIMSPQNGFGYPLPASERRHQPLHAAQATLPSSTDEINAHTAI